MVTKNTAPQATSQNKLSESEIEHKWIAVRDLTVRWRSAQREFPVTANAKRIAGEFDPEKFGTLAVTLPDERGKHHIVDGETRATAVKILWGEMEQVPCEVLPTSDPKRAAIIFLGRNKGRRSVNPVDNFRNSVTAEDPDSMVIAKVVKVAGYRITSAPYADNNIRAVAALGQALRRWGPDILKDTLDIIRATWGPGYEAVAGPNIVAYANILGEYHKVVNYGRLVEVMRKRFASPTRLKAAGQGMREATGGSLTENVQRIITDNYNRGLRVGQLK